MQMNPSVFKVFMFVSSDPLQKDEINKKAFEKFKKEHSFVAPTIDNAVPSERFEGEYIYTAA